VLVSFTPLQRLVAQVTLEAIADLGFALGGGQALHAHGLGDRLSLRQHPPVVIVGLGPVIDLPDAAASKARALNDRRAARDYLDIHALLTHTGWTPARLFAALRDNLRPVITAAEFAADLAAAGDQDPEDYHAYGLTDADIIRLAADFTTWAAQLSPAEA
jgi:hypothetical protein